MKISVLLAWHGLALLVASWSADVGTLALWLLLAGAPIAPLMGVGATLLDRRVPIWKRSTPFAMTGSAIALGTTGWGQALAGLLISMGAIRGAFLAAAAVALMTAAAVSLSAIRQ